MKIAYLIDTDWIIHYLNGQADVVEKLAELKPEGLAISIISVAELYEGVYTSKRPEATQQAISDFLERIPILNLTEDSCKIFGRERGRLRRQGNIIGDFDLLIAAICLHHNLVLLTNNVNHFERVSGLQIFSLRGSS